MLNVLLLLAGLALLVGGADALVRGVSAIASKLGVSSIVIGMTVVAFGTSTPEVVVNVMAALRGDEGMGLAFGNLVGACTVNIGFVLGLTALIRPLVVEPSVITREIPMMLLTMASVVVLAFDRPINGAEQNVLLRGDGIILLLLFCVFLYYTITFALRSRAPDVFLSEIERSPSTRPVPRRLGLDIALVLVGLVGVAGGGRLTVYAAVELARAAGVSEVLIGLTVVSLGTTLPELTTCLIAARRGNSDIAVGNVVGSNIFNILFIGGVVSTIRPLPVPEGHAADLIVMSLLSLALLPLAKRGPHDITRLEGGSLLFVYVSFVAWRVASELG